MNYKTNLFVCILAALLINLQCSIFVYAADENNPEIDANSVSEETIIEDEQATGTENIIDGAKDLSVDPFAKDSYSNEQMQ